MKKLLLIGLFFFNFLPVWQDGAISLFQISKTHGQSVGPALEQLRDYLAYNNQGWSFTVNGERIYATNNSNTNQFAIIYLNQYIRDPDFQQWAASHNTPLPPSSNEDDDDDDDDEIDWNEVGNAIDDLQDRLYIDLNAMIEYWNSVFGYENSPNPMPCDNTMMWTSFSTGFLDGFNPVNLNTGSAFPDPSNLPCANRFLIGGNIVQLPASQLSNIQHYYFDGSTLVAVGFANGDMFKRATKYDVIEETMSSGSMDQNCPGGETTTKHTLLNKRATYQFVCFGKILDLPGVLKLKDQHNEWFYYGIPDNEEGFVFTPSNITRAVVGDQVVVKTNNGTYYCMALTAEDIARGLGTQRDPDYLPPELHIEHPINLPNWVREFLELFAMPLNPCTIDHANEGLDALHQKADYIAAPNAIKSIMEYKSLAYDLLFGFFYCMTDEEAAKGKSCVEQVALGIMHEAIASFDIVQIRDGIVDVIRGAANMVLQNVQNLTDGVKDVIEQHTATENVDFKQIATEFAEKNVSQVQSVLNEAAAIAENFKKMYFTECDQYQFQDGSTGDVCCYRGGQITMMVVPIILTAGDYAVVKLSGIAAKFGGEMAKRAAQLIRNARSLGKTVLNEIDAVMGTEKVVIRETNNTIISTIKREEEILDGMTDPDIKIVITEADNIIDPTVLDNLTPEVPNALNISKGKLHNSSHKIDPAVDPDLQTKVDDIITNLDPLGETTEYIQDKLFVDHRGLTKLEAKYGPNNNPIGTNGIDGLYIEGSISNPTEIIVCEAKQWDGAGGVSLNGANPTTGLPIQMSDQWVQHVAQKLIDTNDPTKIAIGQMLQNNPSLVKKYLTVVNRKTGDINVLRLGSY